MPLPKSHVAIKAVQFGGPVASLPALPGIYRVVCLPLRLAYVGQSANLVRRCLEHQTFLREGTHTNPRLQGAYNKLGPRAFAFQVLEVWPDQHVALDTLTPAEQRWMDAHGRASLFNVRPAGSDQWLERQVARGEIGGKPVSSSDESVQAGGGDNRTPPADNRPLGRDLSVGTQTSKDWRNRMPGPKRRD